MFFLSDLHKKPVQRLVRQIAVEIGYIASCQSRSRSSAAGRLLDPLGKCFVVRRLRIWVQYARFSRLALRKSLLRNCPLAY
ncbi:MAG: hypothetical protein FJ405_06420 [Verrucomicrobia bacterium]|nr:hypothetical protein [Verrucomicrobiota bacterium]